MTDYVNKPPHYNDGDVECIDGIQSALTPEEFRGFCKGTAMRYVWRAGKKFDGEEDIEKAQVYLAWINDKEGRWDPTPRIVKDDSPAIYTDDELLEALDAGRALSDAEQKDVTDRIAQCVNGDDVAPGGPAGRLIATGSFDLGLYGFVADLWRGLMPAAPRQVVAEFVGETSVSWSDTRKSKNPIGFFLSVYEAGGRLTDELCRRTAVALEAIRDDQNRKHVDRHCATLHHNAESALDMGAVVKFCREQF